MVIAIAEIGISHSGRACLAKRLIEDAKAAGFDAVKLQYFTLESLEPPSHRMWLDDHVLHLADMADVVGYANSISMPIGMSFFTGRDAEEGIRSFGGCISFVKIPSGQQTNTDLIYAISEGFHDRNVILSTGMADQNQIARLKTTLQRTRSHEDITILKCTSSYPTAAEDVNLSGIKMLKECDWAQGCRIGFSSHAVDSAILGMAVAAGAEVIEVHICPYDYTGPDMDVSWRDAHLPIDAIRIAERIMGIPTIRPSMCELPAAEVMIRRSFWRSQTSQQGV